MSTDRPTLADLAATPALTTEVDLDHVPEVLGEMEQLPAILRARLCCRRRLLGHDEMQQQQQHATGLGLQRLRMDGQEVIAQDALLLVPDPVSLQHLFPALYACDHGRHSRRVAW